MTTYNFSALGANQHLSFNRAVDVLRFDSTAITAADVRLTEDGANLGFSYGGKTVWVDGMASVAQLASFNLSFDNGSLLMAGIGYNETIVDWYGQNYRDRTTLATSTVGNQVWGLGGADVVETGSGNDWIVGNLPLDPLTHLSRVGETGSPTSSVSPSISADSHFVAFSGAWTSFGSTSNNNSDVVVMDTQTGTVTNEHQSAAGVGGNSGAGSPVVSADGTVLAFMSASSNLVSGTDGSLYDIYASQIGGPAIERVSTGTGGTLAADGRSLNPDLSADGRSVVFESSTSNWAPGGSTAYNDIFLKDRTTDKLTRISTSLTGGDGNGESRFAKISADGSIVVFESAASDMTGGDTNGYTDIFLWDRSNGRLIKLSSFDPATTRNPNNSSNLPDIAYDYNAGIIVNNQVVTHGVIVFQTAKALSAHDTNNQTDIYALSFTKNLSGTSFDNTFQLVSSKADGTGVQLSSSDASVSGDGRFVVFTSSSEQLVPGDSNGYSDVFVKDLHTGEIALVSRSAAGTPANQHSGHAQISLGGDWIVFESSATSLAPATDGNGGLPDVFGVSNPLLRDTLAGGSGNDTYVLSRADIVVEQANGGTDTIQSSIDYTLGANLENLTLGQGGTATVGVGNQLNNALAGNALNNTLSGLEGSDTLTGGSGNDTLDGGAGVDTAVYSGARAGYTVTRTSGGLTVSGADGVDTLTGVERLKFADATVAMDIDGTGGQAYRIYQAAFNRTPDGGGLGYWIKVLDDGAALRDVALGFVGSAEFQSVYGANPTNAQLVSRYYENVLHRAPEAGGYNYWLGVLDQHLDTPAGVLANISESGENQTGVIGVIGNGFPYTPYG